MSVAEPWGECRPRGLAAVAFAALRHGLIRGGLKKPVYRFIQHRCAAQDVEYAGLKLRCHISDNGPERFVIFQDRGSEKSGLELATGALAPGDTFVDVGANFGLFSAIAARKVGPTGRVIAIEPLPELVERLRFNLSLNELTNCTIVSAAVGDRAGEARLFLNKRSYSEASMRMTAGRTETTVPIMTLQGIVEQAGATRIDALKIDIEGYEDKAIVPYIRSAPRPLWPKRIYMEILHARHWDTDCVAVLQENGYRVASMSKGDALLVRDI
jgi:FkbM family methyltransferase